MRLFRTLSAGAAVSIGLMGGLLSAPAIAGAHLDATDDIYWMLTLDLADGQEEAFEALMTDMVVANKEEPGTKNYEWHRSGDVVHIYERFETNDDAGAHLGNFGANFAERFFAILTPTSFTVYGPAEGGVREGLTNAGAVFFDQVGGFSR